MPVNYPGEDDLVAVYRAKPSDWLQEQLTSGSLTQTAEAVASAELVRRGEQPSPCGPPPLHVDGAIVSIHGSGPSSQHGEVVVKTKRPWPWWIWPVLFLAGLAYALSRGTKPQVPQDQGLLVGAILLQAVAMVLLVAAFRFLQGVRSMAGALGGLVLLAIPAVALFLLWLLSSIARHGFGG